MTTNTMERTDAAAPKDGRRLRCVGGLGVGGYAAVVYRAVDPVAVLIGMVAIACAGLVASGKRWGLVAAVVVVAAMALFDLPVFVQRLADPSATAMFVVSLLGLVTYVVMPASHPWADTWITTERLRDASVGRPRCGVVLLRCGSR